MQKIKFLGAAGEVTGSCYVLTAENGDEVLIDLGMFQGGKELDNLNYAELQFKPSTLKGVFLTHAHLDHCGRLPLLVFGGYYGKIYMTAPTRALVEVILNDSAKISMEDASKNPLYTIEEVQKVLEMIEIVEYDTSFSVGSFSIIFKDAGHILGSSSILFTDKTNQETIVFSGDLGNSPEDIVRPTALIDTANIVVMESTYGDKAHPVENPREIIKEEINAVEASGGVLLIPAFSLERTQEILHNINHLKKDGLVRHDTPVFLDSPMAIHATTIFKDFKEYYNEELRQHTDDPFNFEGLVISEDARNSKEIIRAMNPKVIIAGSGMMSGGRILHHALNYLAQPQTRVLFVGYQAEETMGRKILDGIKSVWIHRKNVQVKAHIREIASLSSHADQPKLLLWLKHIQGVKKVILIHGDTEQRKLFAEKVKQDLSIQTVNLPQIGDEIAI